MMRNNISLVSGLKNNDPTALNVVWLWLKLNTDDSKTLNNIHFQALFVLDLSSLKTRSLEQKTITNKVGHSFHVWMIHVPKKSAKTYQRKHKTAFVRTGSCKRAPSVRMKS